MAVFSRLGPTMGNPGVNCCNQPGLPENSVLDAVTRVIAFVPAPAAGKVAGRLLLKHQRRPADSLPLEVDSHLNAVGDLDEGDALIHPVILTVEGHCPFDLT